MMRFMESITKAKGDVRCATKANGLIYLQQVMSCALLAATKNLLRIDFYEANNC